MDNQHHWPLSGHWYRSPRLHCLAGKEYQGISRSSPPFTLQRISGIDHSVWKRWGLRRHHEIPLLQPDQKWQAKSRPMPTYWKVQKAKMSKTKLACPRCVPVISGTWLGGHQAVHRVSRHKYSKLSRGTCLLLCATCLSLGDSCNKQDAGTPQDNAISK